MQKEFGVAYIRISVIQEGQSKVSDTTQLEECNKYLRENNIEVFNEFGYQDLNVSGGNLDRPALNRLREDVIKYNISHICVYDITRLSRSVLDFSDLLRTFDKMGVRIHSAKDRRTIDIKNWDGNTLLSFIQATFGTYEREVVRQKVTLAMESLCRSGFSVGGPAAFGYKKIKVKDANNKDRTSFAIESEEKANVIRDIYNLFLSGKSYKDITEYLNSNEDYLQLLDKGKIDKIRGRKNSKNTHLVGQKYLYNLSFVARVLNQFLYTGYMCSKTVDRENKKSNNKVDKSKWLYSDNYMNSGPCDFEPIISLDLWERTQELKSKKNPDINKNYVPRGEKSRFLLSGLLVCGGENGCYRRMIGKTRTNRSGKSYNYYYCKTAKKNGEHICGNRKDIRCEKIEFEIISLLKNHILIYQLLDTIHSYSTLNKDSSSKLEEYNAITFKIKELDDEIAFKFSTLKSDRNPKVVERVYKNMEELQQEIDILQAQANALQSVIDNAENEQIMLLNLVSNILNPDFNYNDSVEDTIQMRNLLKKFIKRIIYSPDMLEIQVYAPKNITAINAKAQLDFRIVSKDKMNEVRDTEGVLHITSEDINKKTDKQNILYLLAETWDREYREGLSRDNLKLLNKCIKLLEHHKNVQDEAVEEFRSKFTVKSEEDKVEDFKKNFSPKIDEDAVKEFAKKFAPLKKYRTTGALIGDLLFLSNVIPADYVRKNPFMVIEDNEKELVISCKIRLF